MQLKKLSDSHYVVVSDEEIKMDDWYLDDTNSVRQAITECESYWTHRKNYKKITHSTQPLNTKFNDWFDAKMIDLSYIKSLIGEIDVEKMVDEKYKYVPVDTELRGLLVSAEKRGYVDGYNQCLEDNKDKIFSVEDLRKAFTQGKFEGINMSMVESNDYIKSLRQPKDTWEVEFIDGQLKLK